MPPKDAYRLQHMFDAANEIVSFLRGRSRSDLDTDRKLALSLVALYQILGEASKNVSPELRQEFPQIEWTQIARMRDRIAHGCFDIDLDVLWDTAQAKLPNLIVQLDHIISQQRLDLRP